MAIKAGQILHDVNGFVVDRIQTAGMGNLNIPEEKIYELGNYQTVATVRDIPDLSFDIESLDVSTEIESLLTDQSTATPGSEFDFLDAKPMDVISPFKAGTGLFNIVKGLAIPFLTLESVTYRFGMRQNATEQFTLRGDSIFYIPGTPYYQEWAAAGTGPYALAHTALPYNESGDTLYVLGLCYLRADGTYRRLFYGTDYTNTATTFTLLEAPPVGATIRAVYGSAAAATYPQTVHEDATVKPAAVRGKDLAVYVSDGAATPTLTLWSGVQSFEVTRRVNLDSDEEFGNPHFVSQDYDTAEVSGSVTVRSRDVDDLFSKIAQVTNVDPDEVAGVLSSQPLPLELHVNHPDTGARVKTLYVPDARFQPPGIQGRVQQKLETTFSFTSDAGTLLVYAGARP